MDKRLVHVSLGCALGACVTMYLVSNKEKASREAKVALKGLLKDVENDEEPLDFRRKAYIVYGGCFDMGPHVVVRKDPDFDLNKTIFGAVESTVSRKFVAEKVGIKIFFSEEAGQIIERTYAKLPRAPRYDQALTDFMMNECNFAMEHADGSFESHLMFCYEYSHKHFKDHSPRVLLLHSIMGVGTNFFPMEKEKIPKLQSLVTEFEFDQIAMFPSVLRLLNHGPFLDQLYDLANENPGKLDQIEKLVCYRVIDNERIEMDANAMWVQLQYQLMHLLDFLPIEAWKSSKGDIFLRNFELLYTVLKKANKLWCNVDFDLTQAQSGGGRISLASAIFNIVPPQHLWNMGRKNIQKFSQAIGHNLQYQLTFFEK